MGISASKTTTLQTGWNLTASFEETGTNTPNNTSTIRCDARVAPVSSAYYFDYTNAADLNVYWHDNNTNTDQWVAGGNRNSASSSSNATASGSITVTHKADGTLSGYAKAVWSKKYNSGWIPASGNVSTDTKALTKIPRKSKPTASPSSLSLPGTGTLTITTNRAATSFTHTITLKVGNTQIAETTSVGDSATYNVADIQNAILATIPNATTATLTAVCRTYSGSTDLGTEETTIAISVNDQAAPTFSNYTYADTNSTTTTITGNNQVLISGKSTLTAYISAAQAATAKYSATMNQYSFTINAQSATEAYTEAAITKNLGTVTLPSTTTENQAKDLVVAAIDSRGKQTSLTRTVVVIPYTNPTISASAARLNGFENQTTLTVSGSVSPLLVNGTGKNSVNSTNGLQYRYKAQSTTTWGSWTNIASTYNATTGAVSANNVIINLDNQTAYDLEFKLTDKLGSSTVAITVSQGQPAFYIGTDGRISVGGMPTIAKVSGKQGQLQVFGNAYANGNRLAELPIAASDLTGTITTSQIADGAVTNAKIDQASTLPGWSTFYIPTNNTDTTHTLTLKSGKTLIVHTINGGTGIEVTGGTAISSVKVVKVKLGCKFGATNNSDAGIGQVNPNTTVYTRVIGQSAGSAINPTEQTHSPGSSNFTSVIGLGGNKSGINFEYTAMRWNSDAEWAIFGNIGYHSTNSWARFEARCSSSTIPHIYQRGGTSASAVGFCIYEVFEQAQ